ncbi:MAG: hypothetical protein KatS3mg121_0724 [Gammaproteobacteria bacterium]|nr:MAG: hypothetical protein KatS3mg121_0724 [Gammaproteobacteria bacterium]
MLARQFVEVLIAPGFDDGALARFAAKPNVRLLECAAPADPAPRLDYKRIDGGLLVQEDDPIADDPAGWRVVTRAAPDEAQWRDLAFAWRVVAYVKSNAIVYARDGRTLGIGAGQMSRVFAARIGALKAAEEGLSLAGCVLASDAFFPFRDGVDQAAEAGVRAIVQPGGAKRDEEVIAAADEHGIAMVFTGTRHFRH